MMNSMYRFFQIGVLCAVIGLDCSTNSPSAGIEIKNGNCVGTIYNQDSTVAAGAVVRLIPAGYDPRNPSTGRLDSTTTNKAGQYAFDVDSSAFYNIIAEKGATSCMLDSVAVQVDGTTTADDTLKASGKLAGRVSVKPGDNACNAVILIMGTNSYTAPGDSAGNLTELQLPAGNFSIKAFTSDNGYGVFDSTITITSGKTTELIVRIPTNYTAEISNFRVTLDSATLYTKLQWAPVDTSKLLSYAVHRTTSGKHDTLIAVNRDLSSYTDDCIEFFEDSVTYEIAAVGKNFKEGYKVSAPPIVICGKVQSMNKTLLNNYTYGDRFRNIAVSSGKEIYLHDYRSIIKIDATGKLLKKVNGTDLIDKSVADSGSESINLTMTDKLDHVYAYVTYQYKRPPDSILNRMTTEEFLQFSSRHVRVFKKFDSNLNEIAEFSIPDSVVCTKDRQTMRISYGPEIAVGDDGSVYFQSFCGTADAYSTKILVYDTDFRFKNEFVVNSEICIQRSFGDTIIAISAKYPDADPVDDAASLLIIKIFDASFNLLSSFEAMDVFASYRSLVPVGYRPATKLIVFPDDIYITVIGSGCYTVFSESIISKQFLIVSDYDGKLLSRYALPGDFQFTFQSPGLLYGISHFSGSKLYKVSLTPFSVK